MNDGPWKDFFQGHVEGSESERAELFAALSEAAERDPQAIEEFLKLRDVHALLRAEFSPGASDEAFVRGVCNAVENKQKQSSQFVLEVVNKNEKRRTTAILRKRQRIGYSAVAAAVLLVVGVWFTVTSIQKAPSTGPTVALVREPIGHIVLLERPGETPAAVTIRRAGETVTQVKEIAARTGEVLYRDDEVNIPAGTQSVPLVELVLKDVGTVQVYPGTKVNVSASQANPLLNLNIGRLLMNVPPLPVPKTVAVRTPHAIATVLGTRFSLIASADATRLEVYESKVRMQMLGTDGQPLPSNENRTTDTTVDSGFSASTSIEGLKVAPLPRETFVAEHRQNENGYTGAQEVTISTQLAKERNGQGITLFDDDEVLITNLENKYEKRALVRFTGMTLPRDAKLESAELELAFENFSGDQRLRGEYMSVPWNGEARGRTGLGWFYSDVDKRWSQDGTGPGDWVPGKSFIVSGFQDGFEVRLKVPLDVEQVQNWIQKPETNFGFMLIALDANKPLRMKTSKNADSKLRPVLRLRYTAPTGSSMRNSSTRSLRSETF